MRIVCVASVIAMTSVLAACAGAASVPVSLGSPEAAPSLPAPVRVDPADAYASVARMVNACWLNPRAQLLSKQEFNASATPGGGARINLVEKTASGYMRSFSIDFIAEGGGTSITTQNQRLPDSLAQKLESDVRRWSIGDLTCAPVAVASAE